MLSFMFCILPEKDKHFKKRNKPMNTTKNEIPVTMQKLEMMKATESHFHPGEKSAYLETREVSEQFYGE